VLSDLSTPRGVAEWLLSRGLTPVPLRARSKEPQVPGWQRFRPGTPGLLDLFPDGSNIGILLGEPSGGLLDVDCDTAEAARAARLLLPPTGMTWGRASVGSPTHHAFLTVDYPNKASIQYTGPDGKPLVEIRSTGGQSLLWGTYPPKGSWPEEPVAGWPLGEPARISFSELEGAVKSLAAAALLATFWQPGNRHQLALALAGGLARAGWAQADTEHFVRAVAVAASDEETADRIAAIRTTYERFRAGERAVGWTSLADMTGEATVKRLREWLDIGPLEVPTAEVWPEPVPLSAAQPSAPSFPADVLPAVLRDFAQGLAEELQVPVDLPALLSLTVAGAGIARKVEFIPRPGWREPANLYTMVLLPPGERKSQVFRQVLAPVFGLEAEAQAREAPHIKAAESALRVLNRRIEALEKALAKATDATEAIGLHAELGQANEELAKAQVPSLPIYVVDDDTPEALARELVRQGGRLLAASAEFQALENIRLYSDQPKLDVFLKAHAGDDLRIGRIVRGRERIDRPALSCAFAAQPAALAGMVDSPALLGRGFWARWLYSIPGSKVGWRTVAPRAMPEAVGAAYRELIHRLWEGTNYREGGAAHEVSFSPEAEQVLRAFEGWLEGQLRPGGDLAALAGWGNKLAGLVVRLAGIFHAVEGDEHWLTRPIAPSVVSRAARLAREYAIGHARAAFGLIGTSPVLAGARRIWKWVLSRSEPAAEFSKRDAYRATRPAFTCVDDLDESLGLLERHGLVRQVGLPIIEGKRGRKSSPRFEVNPLAVRDVEAGMPNSVQRGGILSKFCPIDCPEGHASQSDGGQQDTASDGNSVHSVHNVQGVSPPSDEADNDDGGAAVAPEPRPSGPAPEGGGAASEPRFEVVSDSGGLTRLLAHIEATPGAVAIDCETTGLDPDVAKVRLLTIGLASGEVYVIDWFALEGADLGQLGRLLAEREVIGHHLAFDLRFLSKLAFEGREVFDTMIASQLVHAGERDESGGRLSHSLAEVLRRELGITLDKTEQQSDWSGELTASQLRYAAADVQHLHALAERLKARIKQFKLERVATLEMQALPMVASAVPIRVDTDRWQALAESAKAEASKLEAAMNELGGSPINWRSPPQVKRAFERLGIALTSTSDEALAEVDHELARSLRQHREHAKRASAFGAKWLTKLTSDGFVRPSWQQCGAESGRMSCREPNLQQIPRVSEYRRCFVPRLGCLFVKVDYSQVELRVAAVVADERRMLQAYRDGQDLHKLTAAAVTGKPLDQVTKADRQLAKALNFGLLYGMGYRSLRTYAQNQYGVPMTEAEAQRHYAKFFAAYPGLRQWHDQLRKDLRRLGPNGIYEARTLTGRLRKLPAYKLGRGGNPFPNLTEAANYPVQGSAADGLKSALGLLWQRRHECPDARLVLMVHDELVIEVPADQAEVARAWLVQAMLDGMNQVLGEKVPVEVDATITPTWGG
jgi:DNA polymerase-1